MTTCKTCGYETAPTDKLIRDLRIQLDHYLDAIETDRDHATAVAHEYAVTLNKIVETTNFTLEQVLEQLKKARA